MKKPIKRVLCVMLAVAALFFGAQAGAVSAQPASQADFAYEPLEDNTVRVIRYLGTAAEVEIPATLDGYAVSQIGDNAFLECVAVTRVTVPQGVTAIGAHAFQNCFELTRVDLPDGLKTIGASAFLDCAALTQITLPDSVTEIGEYIFENCVSLESVTLSKNLRSVPTGAFFSCRRLSEVGIPDGITVIGHDAFDGCVALKSATLPETLKEIRQGAFEGCEQLAGIELPQSLVAIDANAFKGCASLKSVTVPKDTTLVGSFAFINCEQLVSVTVLPTVLAIGEYAFGYRQTDEGFETQYTLMPDFSLSGYVASPIARYAEENHLPFSSLGSLLPGDADEDGKISLEEVRGQYNALASGGESADVNHDQSADIQDAVLLYLRISGVLDPEICDITLWCPQETLALTVWQINRYNAENSQGTLVSATVRAESEAAAADSMLADPAKAGDIFFFAQDQLTRLVQAGALSKLNEANARLVRRTQHEYAVSAAQSRNELYAYPLTADNGYCMFYDKSVIPDEDTESLEAVLADCMRAGRTVSYKLEDAWYTAGFFIGAGCVSEWITDDQNRFTALHDNWASEKGLTAAKGIQKVVTSPCYVNSAEADFVNGAGAVVTGTWNYRLIQSQLGENFGVCDLPSFEANGTSYHIGSYRGCKLLGVKPQESAPKDAAVHQLAQYLTSGACQLERYDMLGWGPCDTLALAEPRVASDPVLRALAQQAEYAVTQPNIPGEWWDIAKAVGTEIHLAGPDAGEDALWAILEKYEAAAQALIG